MNQEVQACIEACLDCHRICFTVATRRVAGSGTNLQRSSSFQDALNGAELSLLTAHFLLTTAQLSHKLCLVCAEACDLCAQDCERLGGLADCLWTCRRCAETCRKVGGFGTA